jgi:peptidoglycan hydrolase-like protein with peptidoglycan-binding domain
MARIRNQTARPTRDPQALQQQQLQQQKLEQQTLEQVKVGDGEGQADAGTEEHEPAPAAAEPAETKRAITAQTRRGARARFGSQADALRAKVEGEGHKPPAAEGTPDLGKDYTKAPAAEVSDLQTYLNRQGEDLKVDGKFGPLSEAALKRVRETPLDVAGTDWATASTTDVKRLQRYLNARGEDLNVDGKFGPLSEGALDRVKTSEARARAEAEAAKAQAKQEAAASPTAGDHAPAQVPNDPVARRRASRQRGPRAGLGAKKQEETAEAAAAKKAEAERAAAERAAILGKEYSKASPTEDVERLQSYLGARGYDVGDVDGKFGPKTEGQLKLARRRDELLAKFSDVDSSSADTFRFYSPLPSNVDNVIASVVGLDTAMTNKSLSDGEKLVLYETINNAMRRTGERVGGTLYQDYADPELHKMLNKGEVPHAVMLTKSFSDDRFRTATLLGRSTFMQDPEDPDKIYVFDKTDWNPTERNFEIKDEADSVVGSIWNNIVEGDWDNLGPDAYKRFRNWLRDTDDGGAGTENRTFVVLSRKDMEALKAKLEPPPTARD